VSAPKESPLAALRRLEALFAPFHRYGCALQDLQKSIGDPALVSDASVQVDGPFGYALEQFGGELKAVRESLEKDGAQ
jgi:hypothetical protein